MPIVIAQVRLSLVWSVAVPQLFDSNAGTPAYWPGDSARYQGTFSALQSGNPPSANGAQLPWPPRARQRFWSFYSETLQAQLLTANRAWKLLVPFRVPAADPGIGPPAGAKFFQETYLFPHAVGFILGVTLDLKCSLADAVNRAVAIRHEKLFTIGAPAAATAIGAAGIAEKNLRGVLQNLAAPGADAALTPSEPLSIATITSASGDELLNAVQDGGEVHRQLEGLSTLSPSWAVDTIQSIAQGRVPEGRRRPQENVLYGTRYGRAVWHPHDAKTFNAARSPLNCYHRNLSFASLQTQSLLALIGLVIAERAQGRPPSGPFNDFAQRTCGILGRMYGGDAGTYRSQTIRRQLGDSGQIAAVSAERISRGMPALV